MSSGSVFSSQGYWQSRYEAGETRWDKGQPSPPLANYLDRHGLHGRVLVPGCGAGHDVRLLASHGADAIGQDIAPAAVELAGTFPRVANESYEVGDFLDLDARLEGEFDFVFEHTLFCAIDPLDRPVYVESAWRAVRAGGRLLAVFYLDPVEATGTDPPFPVSLPALRSLLNGKFQEEESYIPTVSYENRAGRELLWVGKRIEI